MSGKFGWCIIGSGGIAKAVTSDSEGINIVSVWSRHSENAQKFVTQYNATAYETIKEAVTAPGVDAVYVAMQHPEHMTSAIEAMRLKKPVLCEKPMAVNAAQVEVMINEARKNGVFLMEAMWPRFNPVIKTVREWICSGEIGEVNYLTADFSAWLDDNGKIYHFKRSRAGGALLDMGVYPVALAQMVFGEYPASIAVSSAVLTEDGIDKRMAAMFTYSDGRAASIFTAFDTHSAWTATIHGTRGIITIPEYWRARSASLVRKGGERLEVSRDGCVGWGYQMRAVEAMVSAGALESKEMSLQDSLDMARITDEMRRQAGVKYEWD